MRVSLEWLNDYVDVSNLQPEDVAEDLTNAGLEVEAIERLGALFSGVRLGKMLAVEKHPNADRLNLVTVETGQGQAKVVCGANNVQPDTLIAYAEIGATVISRKDNTLFTLQKAKIRGVESSGMICSLDELGLSEKYPDDVVEGGIWHMTKVARESQIGQPLEAVLNLKTDLVLDTAPTANRGDLMSMIGVAREVAALYNRPVTLPELKELAPTPESNGYQIRLDDPSVCEYYGGAIMKNLKTGPSPDWMVRRLEAAGVRSHNNVVDITNYVMLEMGQPLHAFDMDRLGTGTVGVRKAKPGETIRTLDGETRKLTEDSVLITLNDRPVAMAGLMGGEDTEIGDDSKHLFLEAAFFPPASNRRSAKSVGLRTEASARFERGVDRNTCRKALFRAVQLYQELASAELAGFVESPPKPAPAVTVGLRLPRIEKLLGTPVERTSAVNILEKLGFGVKDDTSADALSVTVPSYRQHDVSREVDLIEEVIRIHGYGNVPYTLPKKTRSASYSLRQDLIRRIHTALCGAGLQETVTNSLIGEALLEKTGFTVDRDQLVQVTNSHSRDHTLMRQSLLPNLIEIARYNLAQGVENIWLYETGRTYFKRGKASEKSSGVVEKLTISGLMTGSGFSGTWHVPESLSQTDFYLTKGVTEQILASLKLTNDYVFEAIGDVSWLHPGKAAAIVPKAGGKPVGVLGQMHPAFESRLKFRQPVFLFELDFETLFKAAKQTADQPEAGIIVSHYPTVKRDMAFFAPETLTHRQILAIIEGLNEPLITDVTLFDEYRGEQLGAGNRSLAYRLTLQSPSETLTDAVIDEVMARVKQTLSKDLPVTFR